MLTLTLDSCRPRFCGPAPPLSQRWLGRHPNVKHHFNIPTTSSRHPFGASGLHLAKPETVCLRPLVLAKPETQEFFHRQPELGGRGCVCLRTLVLARSGRVPSAGMPPCFD